MDRGIGEVEATQQLVPESLLSFVEATTRLGDVSILLAVTVVAALVFDRDRGLYLFGIVIGGLALLAGLKAVFGFSRPPEELHVISTATTGFPSGHAFGAALVYGGLTLLSEIGTRRARSVAFGLLVGGVSLSRIVLGVHYLIDIVVGILIALGYLWGIERYTRRDPGRVLAVAAALGVLALVAGFVFGPTARSVCVEGVCLDRDAALTAAAGVGAIVAWIALRHPTENRTFGWWILAPLSVIVGGSVAWVDSMLAYSLVATALAAAALVVLVEREVVHTLYTVGRD